MRKHLDANWLKEELVVKRRTLNDIGGECGVTRERIRQIAKKFGIVKPRKRDLIDIDWLRQEIEEKRRTHGDIANECGVCSATIVSIAREHNIHRVSYTPMELVRRNVAAQNFRHAADPEYRAMKLANTVKWQREHREQYRAYQRKYYHLKKAELDS